MNGCDLVFGGRRGGGRAFADETPRRLDLDADGALSELDGVGPKTGGGVKESPNLTFIPRRLRSLTHSGFTKAR